MMNTSCLSSLRDFKEVRVSPRHPLCSVHGADAWGRARGGNSSLWVLWAVSCSDPLLIQLQGFNKNSMKASNSISQVVEDLL